MKGAWLKVAALFSAVVGASVVHSTPAGAAIIFPTDTSNISSGTVCDFTQAVACSDVVTNDNQSKLKAFLRQLNQQPSFSVDPDNWGEKSDLHPDTNFLAQVRTPNGEPTNSSRDGFVGLNPILSIGYGDSPISISDDGSWRVNVDRTGLTPFVLSLKAGSQYSFNYFDGNSRGDFLGVWDTSRLGSNGFDRAKLWVPNSLVGVPTPALLPGLVGMGVAALRKKRKLSEEQYKG